MIIEILNMPRHAHLNYCQWLSQTFWSHTCGSQSQWWQLYHQPSGTYLRSRSISFSKSQSKLWRRNALKNAPPSPFPTKSWWHHIQLIVLVEMSHKSKDSERNFSLSEICASAFVAGLLDIFRHLEQKCVRSKKKKKFHTVSRPHWSLTSTLIDTQWLF